MIARLITDKGIVKIDLCKFPILNSIWCDEEMERAKPLNISEAYLMEDFEKDHSTRKTPDLEQANAWAKFLWEAD